MTQVFHSKIKNGLVKRSFYKDRRAIRKNNPFRSNSTDSGARDTVFLTFRSKVTTFVSENPAESFLSKSIESISRRFGIGRRANTTQDTCKQSPGKVLIFSAPSGSGKSTIIGRLLERFPQLEFSISATSRAPRGTEADGREYYFLSNDDFKARAAAGEFVEWEEVYAGTCYGTLRSELKRIWDKGHVIVFDVDVKGGVNLKRIFGAQALSVFVMPPSVDELQRRLEGRGTDSPETIARRVAKAEQELAFAPQFDRVVVNDCLATAVAEAERITEAFIG